MINAQWSHALTSAHLASFSSFSFSLSVSFLTLSRTHWSCHFIYSNFLFLVPTHTHTQIVFVFSLWLMMIWWPGFRSSHFFWCLCNEKWNGKRWSGTVLFFSFLFSWFRRVFVWAGCQGWVSERVERLIVMEFGIWLHGSEVQCWRGNGNKKNCSFISFFRRCPDSLFRYYWISWILINVWMCGKREGMLAR